MEKEKSNKILKIFLIVFIIATLLLGGYIVYDKVLPHNKTNRSNKTNTTEKVSNTEDKENYTNYESTYFERKVVVMEDSVNFRTEPTTNSSVITAFDTGTQLGLISDNAGTGNGCTIWYKVKEDYYDNNDRLNSREGYICSEFTRIKEFTAGNQKVYDLTEDEKYFDEYLYFFLPQPSAGRFKKTIDSFSDDDIYSYIYGYYSISCNGGTLKTDQEKNNEEYTGQMTYTVSKIELDELVYKMFGKTASEYSIPNGTGRSGVRKIDDNTYQVFWFATGWSSDDSTIKSATIDGNSAMVEYVLTKYSGIDYREPNGKLEFYLTKNGDNWNVMKIKYTEK